MSEDELAAAWQAFQQGEIAFPSTIAPTIAHSWQRCLAARVTWPRLDDRAKSRIAADLQALLPSIRPMLEDIMQHIEGSGALIAFADVRGRIVEVIEDGQSALDAEIVGLKPGAAWGEEARGTNAIGLALVEAFPMLVSGCEHYCAELHPYFGAAAPVYDGLGLPIGVVGLVGHVADCHPHSLGLVAATAQAITNHLLTAHWLSSAQERLTELNAIVHSLSEGVILLTQEGAISHINARAAHILGLAPSRATGRKLSDLIALPPHLAHALAHGYELLDDELIFQVDGKRTPCVSTLRLIATPPSLSPWDSTLSQQTGISVSAPLPSGFVLSLRPSERVQRLIHRMTGSRAPMTFDRIIGSSPALVEALRLARIAATSNATVLLRGETGSGKDLFAQSIHNGSDRADGPFVAINCAAIPRELITSELFGYEGGAFTGADRQGRPGKFELAHGGTLFLDEIGDMPRDLQTTLLRALETHTITRIGGQDVVQVDVRIIAATHKPLEEDIASGAFRSDLYFRLNVFSIYVPPLRERQDDVPELIAMLLRRHSQILGHPLAVDAEAMAALQRYPWPGNIRELENTIERAVYICENGVICASDLHLRPARDDGKLEPHAAAPAAGRDPVLRRERAVHEAEVIRRAIAVSEGNLDSAARSLGISRTTLWRRRRQLELQGIL
jgi:transcriptional regulator with PAS, ATPase and Fis domain